MSLAAQSLDVARELAAICGETNVRAGEDLPAIDGVAPAVEVTTASEEEIAATLQLASAHGLTVVVAGGMTRQAAGPPPERVSILLRTFRLDAMEHYDPGDLTAGCGAGKTLAALDALLAEHGQMLPVEIAQAEQASLGGLLATARQGPLLHGYGGWRDFTLGIRFVTGDGKRGRGGGRVVKNVAGYDLMKLLIGSYGTLGVITAASFKVFPRPRQTRTWVAEFNAAQAALAFRDRVLRSLLTPIRLELVSPRAWSYLREWPEARAPEDFEAASLADDETVWRVLVCAAGSDHVLARYRAELGSEASRELEGESEKQLWRQVSRFQQNVLERHQNAMAMETTLPQDALAAMLEAGEAAAVDHNCYFACLGRAGVGSLEAVFIPLLVDPPSAMQYALAASQFRAGLPRDASAMVVRCPREAKPYFNLWGSTPTDMDAMRAVKRALDPQWVLNRGRFLV